MRKHHYPHQWDHREKEGNLNDYRLSMGLTIGEVYEKTGVSPGTYCALNNGMMSPLYSNTTLKHRAGDVKPAAQTLADFFGVSPADIWPRYLCDMERKILSDEEIAELLHPNLLDQPTPHQMIARERLWTLFGNILNDQQWLTLLLRCFGYTLGEIGRQLELPVSVTRVGQIERRAISRLKHCIHERSDRIALYEEAYGE